MAEPARKRDALRLRRADRRAQCRQVDAGQCAGRHQGLDRHAQGADHAHADARHRDRRRGADHLRRHAGHFRAAPPARPRDGGDRLGRRAGRRHRRLLVDAATGVDDEDDGDPRRLAEVRAAEGARAQQGRCRRQADAAGARAGAQRARGLRRDLHDLGAHRRRRRRPQALSRARTCRRGRGSIRRTRSPMRRCASSRPRSPARSFICGCTRNCRTSRRSRPKLEGAARTARCASSRRSMSSARASARSCSARAARRSRRSARRRARRSPMLIETAGAPVPVRQGARGLGRRPGRYREMGLEFPREDIKSHWRASAPDRASVTGSVRGLHVPE